MLAENGKEEGKKVNRQLGATVFSRKVLGNCSHLDYFSSAYCCKQSD